MAKKTGADVLLQLLDEVRSMQQAQTEMKRAQAGMQHALADLGGGLNRVARLISTLVDLTGLNEQRLEEHEVRLRALEQHIH